MIALTEVQNWIETGRLTKIIAIPFMCRILDTFQRISNTVIYVAKSFQNQN